MLAVNALVVDDSRTAIMVLRNQLNRFDVVVESAPDGVRALESLRDHHPDVIFLDHVMPGLDGFQVLQRIRENQATKNIPVVMYTSQAAPLYIKEARTLGAIAVIPKNVTQEELSEALDKAELYRLTAANDDFSSLSPRAKTASSSQDAASVSRVPRSGGAEPRQRQEDPEPATVAQPVGQPVDSSGTNATEHGGKIPVGLQATHSQTVQPPVRNRTVFLLLALLTFAQGYEILSNRQQQETISDLQQQLLQQDRKLPEMRAQLAAQQQQLGESISQQMEFLITILTHQPPIEEMQEFQGTDEQDSKDSLLN